MNAGRSFTVRVVDCIDADGDSYGDNCSAGPDCDDNDSSINPGAAEICNGIDDNCDGQIDDGLPVATYYQDSDSDGYGNPAVSMQACTAPAAGYVTDGTDCDDTDPDLHDNCITCTIALKPATMSKLLSFFFPVRRIVITAQQAAVFPADPAIDWGTDSIETISSKRKNDTTIIAWVRIKPRLLEINETYAVTVGDCTGAMSIRGF